VKSVERSGESIGGTQLRASDRLEWAFVRAMDARDAGGLRALFAKTGTMAGPAGTFAGDEIRDYYTGRFSDVGQSQHFINLVEERVDGGTLTSTWYVMTLLGRPSQVPLLLFNSYIFCTEGEFITSLTVTPFTGFELGDPVPF
jgi:SnoaL-like domain